MLNKFEKDMEKLEKATRTLEKAIALAEVAGPSQFKKKGANSEMLENIRQEFQNFKDLKGAPDAARVSDTGSEA